MKKFATPFIIMGTILVPLLCVAPAAAQNTHSYVSKGGSDSFTCDATGATCLTIGGAVTKTNDGGTITVFGGDYTENVVISGKGLTIRGDGGTAPTGAGPVEDRVYIHPSGAGTAITFNGADTSTLSLNDVIISNITGGTGVNGVQFNTGRRLQITSGTSISGFTNLSLNFAPSAPASGGNPTTLFISSSTFTGATNGNILIKPTAGVVVGAILSNVTTRYGLFGVRVDNSGGSGALHVNVKESLAFSHSTNGYLAVGSGANQVTFMLDRITSHHNGAFGAVATGAQAFMIVTESTITNNATAGLAQQSSATVATFTDNAINFNAGGVNTSGTITAITKK